MMQDRPGNEPGKQQPLLATKFLFGEYQARHSPTLQPIKVTTTGFGNTGSPELKRWSKCVKTKFGSHDQHESEISICWWNMIVDREKVQTIYTTGEDYNEIDDLVSDEEGADANADDDSTMAA
jgi:hypothetical protein